MVVRVRLCEATSGTPVKRPFRGVVLVTVDENQFV